MAEQRTQRRMVRMTEGSEIRHILKFMLPMLIGNLFQQLYTMVDSIVVGRFVSATALGSVGSVGSIQFLFLSLCIGLAGGVNVTVAQHYGAEDEEGVKRAVGNAIYVAGLSGLLMSVISVCLASPILHLMGVPDANFADALTYMRIVCGAMLVNAAYNTISQILCALGDSRMPLYFVIISSIINVSLDLLFVAVFHWGVAGVAWATVIAQLFSAAGAILVAYRKHPVLKLKNQHMLPSTRMLSRICWMGYEVSFKRAEEGEEEELKTGSTDYTIVFYSFDGTEVGRCAYDGQYIYNDTEKVCGTGCEKVRMEKDPEGLDSDKGQADSGYKGEVGIAYVKAVSTTDDTCTLALNHNGTYQDLIGEYEVVGTWKKDGNTYTLTPDDSTDTGAVVVVSDAGDTATYTPDGGEAVELTIDVSKPVVVQFVGIAPGAAAGNDADLWINCYTDSTAEVFIGAFGVELSCGTGTYETNEDGSIVVTIDGMDPMTLALDAANDVSIVGTPVGDISTSVEKGEH